MMNITKQKSKKTATTPHEIEPPIEQEVNKKESKKPIIEESIIAAETTEAFETVEIEAKTNNKKRKNGKAKVIRDSFSFPEQDYLKISELKKTCLAAGIHVKKGEILRAGLHLLAKLTLEELKQVVDQVEKVQTGRPSSSEI